MIAFRQTYASKVIFKRLNECSNAVNFSTRGEASLKYSEKTDTWQKWYCKDNNYYSVISIISNTAISISINRTFIMSYPSKLGLNHILYNKNAQSASKIKSVDQSFIFFDFTKINELVNMFQRYMLSHDGTQSFLKQLKIDWGIKERYFFAIISCCWTDRQTILIGRSRWSSIKTSW